MSPAVNTPPHAFGLSQRCCPHLSVLQSPAVVVTNDAYINALSIIELMTKLVQKYTDKPITLVMDNARYQKCSVVTEFAQKHGIELLYLSSYSPNLNLIERLWKLVKKKCLYCKYYESFTDFKAAIDNCLKSLEDKNRGELVTLVTEVSSVKKR